MHNLTEADRRGLAHSGKLPAKGCNQASQFCLDFFVLLTRRTGFARPGQLYTISASRKIFELLKILYVSRQAFGLKELSLR